MACNVRNQNSGKNNLPYLKNNILEPKGEKEKEKKKKSKDWSKGKQRMEIFSHGLAQVTLTDWFSFTSAVGCGMRDVLSSCMIEIEPQPGSCAV